MFRSLEPFSGGVIDDDAELIRKSPSAELKPGKIFENITSSVL